MPPLLGGTTLAKTSDVVVQDLKPVPIVQVQSSPIVLRQNVGDQRLRSIRLLVVHDKNSRSTLGVRSCTVTGDEDRLVRDLPAIPGKRFITKGNSVDTRNKTGGIRRSRRVDPFQLRVLFMLET